MCDVRGSKIHFDEGCRGSGILRAESDYSPKTESISLKIDSTTPIISFHNVQKVRYHYRVKSLLLKNENFAFCSFPRGLQRKVKSD